MKEEILKLRREGKTYNEIVEILGCAKSTINYHCKKIENNEEIKKINVNSANLTKDKFLLSDIKIIKKIIELRKEKKTYKEISNELNIGRNEISKICRKLNLYKNYGELSNEKIEEIKSLYNELKSSRKVEKILNISRKTILKYVNVEKKEKTITKSQAVINWRKRAKIKLVEYKGGKCEMCGYDKYIEVLEFHHKDRNKKDFTISGKSWSFERLEKEVDKCIMLCSNCHKE